MMRSLLAVVDTQSLDEVYACAHDLYQRQQYRDALPMALYLSIQQPKDLRFLFIAGMILQCLGDPLMGATFHAFALQIDPTFVPAAYRLAECYTMLGEDRDARELFEATLDMGRDSEEFFALQRTIMEKLGQMN